MEIDKRYYLQIFCTQHQELRDDVVDYFMALLTLLYFETISPSSEKAQTTPEKG